MQKMAKSQIQAEADIQCPPGVTACQLNPWLGGVNRSGRLNT